MNNNFFKTITLVATVLLLISCDKEYNSIGSDLVDNNNLVLINMNFKLLHTTKQAEL
jgi:hypothetical protein